MNPRVRRVAGIATSDPSRTACAFAVAITLGFASSVMATPEGGVFATPQGGGFINHFGTVTNVGLPGELQQPSNRHIIDWTSLSLAQNETLNYFGQTGYRVLNRVSGSGATQIDGMLNATTGHVYIVNAAGVIFGQNSIVNASSLHAAAASVTNVDFLTGDSLTFNVGAGDVQFHGTLNGTDHVSLIGRRVENTGTINAGMVIMAIGDTIILKDLLNSRIAVEIDGSDMNRDYTAQAGSQEAMITSGDPGISNSGTVTASTGVTLATGDMLGLAIQHSGEIHAEGGAVELLAQGGAIWTRMDNLDVATSGLIDVGDTTAGTIDIIGTAIVHQGLARAIGDGGSIALRSYANTILTANGRIDTSGGAVFGGANAGAITVESTNGTVWADQDTAIVATGGVWSGNGGNVTIDGDSLAFLPIVRQTAGNGEAGQLTIHSAGKTRVNTDTAPLPAVNFTLLSQSVIADGEFGRVGVGTGQTLSFVSSTIDLASTVILRFEASLQGLVGDATLASQDIQLAMDDSSQTIAAPNLELIGGITMESHATLLGESSLTLTGQGVAGDGVSHLNLQSNSVAFLQGDLGSIDAQLGSLEIAVGNDLSLSAGTADETMQSIHVSGDVTIGINEHGFGNTVTLSAEDSIAMRAGGDVTIGLASGSDFNVNSGADMDLESAGTISNYSPFAIDGSLRISGAEVVNAADLTAGSIELTATGAGDMNTSGLLLSIGEIRIEAADGLTLNNSRIESLDNNVSLRAGGDITNNAPITASQGVVDIASTGGTITNAAAINGDSVILAAAGDLTVQSRVDAIGDLTATTAAGALSVDAVMNGADVILSGGDGVQLNQEVTATKGMTIDSSAGDIMVAASMAATNDLSITATGSLDIQASVAGESVSLRGDAGVAVNEIVASSTTLLIDSAAGDVAIDAAITADDRIELGADQGSLTTSVALSSGEFNLHGGDVMIDAALSIAADRALGDITLLAMTGDLQVNDAINAPGTVTATSDAGQVITNATIAANDIAIVAATGVTVTEVVAADDSLEITTTSGDATISGQLLGSNTLLVRAAAGMTTITGPVGGGDVTIEGSDGVLVQEDSLASNSLTASSSTGDVTINARFESDGVTTLASAQGEVNTANTVNGESVAISAAGDVNLAGDVNSNSAIAITTDTGSVSSTGEIAGATDVSIIASQGDIQVAGVRGAQSVAMTAAGSLTGTGELNGESAGISLDAGTTIDLSALVTGSSVEINAGQGITLAGAESTTGDVDITGSTISAGGAIASANDVNMTSTNEMDLAGTVAATGSIALGSDQGTVSVGGDISGASVAILAPGTISLGGDVASGSSIEVTSAGGSVSSTGNLAATTDAQVLASQGDIQVGSVTGSFVTINAGQGITLAGAESTTGDVDITGSTISAGGAIASANDVNMTSTNEMDLAGTVAATGSIALGSDQGTVSVGGDISGASVAILAPGTISLGGDVASGSSIEVTSAGGSVSSTGNLAATTDAQVLASQGDIQVGSVTGSFVTINAGQGITLAGAESTTGDVDITGSTISAGGAIASANDVNMTSTNEMDLAGTVAAAGLIALGSDQGTVSVGGDISGASVAILAPGTISLGGDVASGSSIEVTSAGGSVSSTGNLAATTDAQVLASQGDIQVGSVTGSFVTINAGQGITLAGAESTTGDVDITGSTISAGGAIASANDVNMTSTNEMDLAGTVAATGSIALGSDQGTVSVGGDISGASVAILAPGTISLGGDVASGSSIEVTSAGGSVSSTGNLAATTDAQVLASQGDIQVGSVTGSFVTINAGQGITLAGAESTTGDVDITGSTISAGGAIASANDVNMTSTNEMDLAGTVAAAGLIALGSDQGTVSVGGDISGASVAILAPGTISLGGDVASGSSIEVTSAGGSVSSTGNLAATTDAQVLASQGDIQVGSVTGSFVTINAGQGITLAGAESTTGDVDITGSTISAGGAIASANDVNMTSTNEMDLAGTVAAAGLIALGSDQGTVSVGGDISGASVAILAPGTISLGGDVASGSSIEVTSAGGSVSSTGNLAATTDAQVLASQGDIQVGSVTGSFVTINAGQGITLAGAESTTGDVDITGSTISAGGAIASANDVNMTSTNEMDLAGTVAATGSIALGSDQGSVSVGAVHGQSVTLTAADDLTIQNGSVVGETVAINVGPQNHLNLSDGSIEVTAGDLELEIGTLSTTGEAALSASGDVRIHDGINRSTIKMSSGSLNMSAGNDLTLNATIDGGGSLQATAGDKLRLGGNIGEEDALDSITLTAPRLILGGVYRSVDTIQATNDIALNETNLDALVDGLPSVYGFGDSLDIKSALGDITIGNYQGLAYLGDLSLTAGVTAGGQVTVGDVTTLGDFTIEAASIRLHRREATSVLDPSGLGGGTLTESAQTSIISGGVLSLSGALGRGDGEGPAPRFAGVEGVSGVSLWDISLADAFRAPDMELTFDGEQRKTLLPVASTGPTDPDIVAEETHLGEVEFQIAATDLDLRLVETAVLAEMGIQVVDGLERPSGNNRFSRAGLVENEMVATINGPDSSMVRVVRSRLSPQYVRRAVMTYADAINTGDSAGSLATAGGVLRDAQDQYAQQSTATETQATYRAWLSSGDSPIQQQASRILTSLDATFSDLYRAGLTESEVAASRRFVAAQMSEDGEPVQLVAKSVQVLPAS